MASTFQIMRKQHNFTSSESNNSIASLLDTPSRRKRDIIKNVAYGKSKNIPLMKYEVRAFLSSTFSNFCEERNNLHLMIYKRLRPKLAQLGIDFDIADMRWGVTDAAGFLNVTDEMCIDSINYCRSSSLGLYFIGLLGERYGTVSLPVTITKVDFKKFEKELTKDEAKQFVITYSLDENYTTPAYQLKTLYEFYNMKVDSYSALSDEDKATCQSEWKKNCNKLQVVLQKASKKLYEKGVFTQDEMLEYFTSVTEKELRIGVKQTTNENELKYILSLRRFIGYDKDQDSKEAFSDFIDGPDDTRILNEDFIERNEELVKSLINNINGLNRTLTWYKDGITADSIEEIEEYRKYMDEFVQFHERKIYEIVKRKLNEQTNRILETFEDMQEFELYTEFKYHLDFANEHSRNCYGRGDILDRVHTCLKRIDYDKVKNLPIAVSSESGTGKTTFMAKLYKHLKEKMSPKTAFILRFLGTSSKSCTLFDMLTTLIKQIVIFYELRQQLDLTDLSLNELIRKFHELLDIIVRDNKVTKDAPLVMIIDSIDQLTSDTVHFCFKWLPFEIPKYIHIIISFLPKIKEAAIDYEMEFETKYPWSNIIDLPRLNMAVVKEITKHFLQENNRTLTKVQKEVVERLYSKEPSPLFLKLTLNNVLKWKSTESLKTGLKIFHSFDEIIIDYFIKMETKYGKLFVDKCLSLLTTSKIGISDVELEDIISCDNQILAELYVHHEPPLAKEGVIRIPNQLWPRLCYDLRDYLTEKTVFNKKVRCWSHRKFHEAAKSRYLCNYQKIIHVNAQLANYFNIEDERFLLDIELTKLKKDKEVEGEVNVRGKKIRFIPNADRLIIPQVTSVKNPRKLDCFVHYLINAKMWDLLNDKCFFNFNYLYSKLKVFGWNRIISDIKLFKKSSSINDESVNILKDFFYQSDYQLKANNDSLAYSIIGRLALYCDRYPLIEKLYTQCVHHVQSNPKIHAVPLASCFPVPEAFIKRTVSGVDQAIALAQNNLVLFRNFKVTCINTDSLALYELNISSKTKNILSLEVINDGQVIYFLIEKNNIRYFEAYNITDESKICEEKLSLCVDELSVYQDMCYLTTQKSIAFIRSKTIDLYHADDLMYESDARPYQSCERQGMQAFKSILVRSVDYNKSTYLVGIWRNTVLESDFVVIYKRSSGQSKFLYINQYDLYSTIDNKTSVHLDKSGYIFIVLTNSSLVYLKLSKNESFTVLSEFQKSEKNIQECVLRHDIKSIDSGTNNMVELMISCSERAYIKNKNRQNDFCYTLDLHKVQINEVTNEKKCLKIFTATNTIQERPDLRKKVLWNISKDGNVLVYSTFFIIYIHKFEDNEYKFVRKIQFGLSIVKNIQIVANKSMLAFFTDLDSVKCLDLGIILGYGENKVESDNPYNLKKYMESSYNDNKAIILKNPSECFMFNINDPTYQERIPLQSIISVIIEKDNNLIVFDGLKFSYKNTNTNSSTIIYRCVEGLKFRKMLITKKHAYLILIFDLKVLVYKSYYKELTSNDLQMQYSLAHFDETISEANDYLYNDDETYLIVKSNIIGKTMCFGIGIAKPVFKICLNNQGNYVVTWKCCFITNSILGVIPSWGDQNLIWDIDRDQHHAFFKFEKSLQHNDPNPYRDFLRVAISNQKYIIAGDRGGRIHIWKNIFVNQDSVEEAFKQSVYHNPLTIKAHRVRVDLLEIYENYLFSVGADTAVRLWDATNGTQLHEIYIFGELFEHKMRFIPEYCILVVEGTLLNQIQFMPIEFKNLPDTPRRLKSILSARYYSFTNFRW